jgi:copper chaperone CopZ
MKSLNRLFIILLMTSFSFIICNCNNNTEENDNPQGGLTKNDNMRGVYFSVRILTCEKCVNKIQGTLLANQGVVSAEAFLDRPSNNVKIIYDPTLISLEQLKTVIERDNVIDDFKEF